MKAAILILAHFSAFLTSYAQDGRPEKNALEKYDIIQYASITGYGPQNIALLDNNGDILLACKKGMTKDDLKKTGLSYTESQLVLLETWRLLTLKEDTVKTVMTILDSAETRALRGYSRHVAEAVCDSTAELVTALNNQLDEIKRSRNTYSIIFSYVVDGLVWRYLEGKRLLTPRTIGPDSPFWAGEVWALHRPRAFSCGTNVISDRGISMNVNWSDASIPKMVPFVADFKNLGRMFDDYVTTNKIMDTTAKRVFGPFNLFNKKGELTVPIIAETKGNRLYTAGVELSQKIAEAFLRAIDITSLRASCNLRDTSQTLVIVYHEVMWDLMDAYESRGLLKKPAAFADPAHAKPSDISDLVFIVRQ
jgi:hypothetical protein